MERAFSAYGTILDGKRRNLSEDTLMALHFFNWNLRSPNFIEEESVRVKPKQLESANLAKEKTSHVLRELSE